MIAPTAAYADVEPPPGTADTVNVAASDVPAVGTNGRPTVAAWRLIATLGITGALAGLLIVLVHDWARPRIEAYQAQVLRLAVQEVLHQPARYDRLFVYAGAITSLLPAGTDSTGVERVYLGYDANELPVGFAIVTSKAGFQDQIRVIFGFDPRSGRLLGMKVLESKETPGLGDKIEKDSGFVAAFRGVSAPLLGVKSGSGKGDPHEVDMITGATISSRTIVDAINLALERLRPQLEDYMDAGRIDR